MSTSLSSATTNSDHLPDLLYNRTLTKYGACIINEHSTTGRSRTGNTSLQSTILSNDNDDIGIDITSLHTVRPTNPEFDNLLDMHQAQLIEWGLTNDQINEIKNTDISQKDEFVKNYSQTAKGLFLFYNNKLSQ